MRSYSSSTRARISAFCAAKSKNLIGIGAPPLAAGGKPQVQARRISGHHRPRRYVAGNHRSGADQRSFADRDAAHDDGAAADRRAPADHRTLHQPILAALERSVAVGGARHAVVDEDYAMADENPVFNRHARADEGMRGDLAAPADPRVRLHFDERADPGLIPDLASVEIDEV